MSANVLACTTLTGTPAKILDAATGLPWADIDLYSRMKHGDAAATQTLSDALAAELLAAYPHLGSDPAPVLLPVAYLSVPPGCFFVARNVAEIVTTVRARAGLSPARVIKIHKNAVTATDYAQASAEARQAELARIEFALQEPVAGAHVLLIDDVRVTGMAEQTALAALAGDTPASITLGYVTTVAATLAHYPEVEARLNHACVRDIRDLLPAISAGNFDLTIRFVKLCLMSEPSILGEFVQKCPAQVLAQIAAGARDSGSAFAASYAKALAVLDAACDRGVR